MGDWMFNILYTAHTKFSKAEEVSIDAAYLSALLFLVDYTPSLSDKKAQMSTLIESLSQDLKLRIQKSYSAQSDHQLWRYEDWLTEASAVGRVIVFCPNPYSLYTSIVLHLCGVLKISVVGVVVRKFTLSRLIFELQRDGLFRLAKKVIRKLILRTDENSNMSDFSLKKLHDEIVGAQPNIIKACAQRKIPILKVNEFDNSTEWLEQKNPDIGLFTGGGMISKSILEKFKIGVQNLHMGILPQYKGMDVVQAPILEAKPVGLTAHLMEVELDAGPIIQTFEMSTQGYDSLGSLRNALSAIVPVMAIDSLLGIFSDRLFVCCQPLIGRQYYIMHPLLIKLTDNILAFQHQNMVSQKRNIISQNITTLLKYLGDTDKF